MKDTGKSESKDSPDNRLPSSRSLDERFDEHAPKEQQVQHQQGDDRGSSQQMQGSTNK